MSKIDIILANDLRAMQPRLVAIASGIHRRRARPETEVDDLFQEGVLAAFKTLKDEALSDMAAFRRLSISARQRKLVNVAAKVMANKACDILRRAYRHPAHTPIDEALEMGDDSLRRSRAAREDLEAIEAALSGPPLRLYRLVLVHGREDTAWLADQLGLSESQIYRLLSQIKVVAQRVTGITPPPRRARASSSQSAPGPQVGTLAARQVC